MLILATLLRQSLCFVNLGQSSCFVNLSSRARYTTTGGSASLPRRITTVDYGSLGVRTSCPPRVRSCSLGMKVELGPEETVEKFGLEAGLFQALKKDGQKEDGEEGSGEGAATTAKDLLKRYGSAYLITSISLSLVSFGICYVAVSNGVDMAALLGKVGIETNASTETTGTVAVAYAIHKAASPIRFPPTVALTPAVAKFLGKESEGGDAAGGVGDE